MYKKRNNTLLQAILFVFLAGTSLILTISILLDSGNSHTISPVSIQAEKLPEEPSPIARPKKDPKELEKHILNALDDSIPGYSILVDDFLNSFHLEMGSQDVFEAASVNKLPILIALFEQIQNGALSGNAPVVFYEKDRQDYGTGFLRYQKAGGTYTVSELSELMIEKSDNTAAYILANNVLTQRDIQKRIQAWGLGETSMQSNTTSNKDVHLLLKNLFTGKLLSSQESRTVIDLLDNSDFEDRLPALLPNHARVYHKIGSTVGGLHDVGVIVTDDAMYYIGIFTKGISEEERATRAIARMSKVIFDFMTEK